MTLILKLEKLVFGQDGNVFLIKNSSAEANKAFINMGDRSRNIFLSFLSLCDKSEFK